VRYRRGVWRLRCANARPGFTVVEVIVALMVVAVLGGIAIPQISKQSSRRAAHNAREAFIATASKARAEAIRAGEEVLLRVDAANDRVLITMRRDGSTVAQPLDLNQGDIRGSIVGGADFTLCYVPRGFAMPGCGSATAADTIVGFVSPQGQDTAWARITLGRMERR
jgi:prepilin-type N-terminal cleavage/methylation domain-containing protein